MATTENRLSKIIGDDGKSQIIVKLTITRNQRPCFKSGVFISPKFFKPIKETSRGAIYGIAIPKRSKLNFVEVNEATEAQTKLSNFINRLLRICQVTESKEKDLLSKDWIESALLATNHISIDELSYSLILESISQYEKMKEIESCDSVKKNIYDYMDYYLERKQFSVDQTKGFKVIIRALYRYELFVRAIDKQRKDFTLDINTIDKDIIIDFESYLRNEKSLSMEYPDLFKELLAAYPASINAKRKSPQLEDRGDNTIIKLKKRLKAFFNWLNKSKITTNRPFDGLEISSETYGTPVYITLDERNIIADFDLSHRPFLAIQRDIFIFQCLIGCRVSDLLKLNNNSVINEAIEYIPHKTKDERPYVVRVPLNERAKTIIERYKKTDDNRLLPFISAQKYNESIKDIFRLCGINRLVTVLNPTTGEEEKRPINEIASSHMARRTFVGNLYKKVKDPNLVGSLSGHKEGSKAFARYRDIDEDIKKELVNLID